MSARAVEPRFEPARREFEKTFGQPPRVLGFAPGRTELIGNHTDYNGGYVLLGALQLGTWVAAGARDGETCRIVSQVVGESYEFPLLGSGTAQGPVWTRYVEGVLRELQAESIHVPPFSALIDGDLPLGCGLSSSASLEVAMAKALLSLSDAELDDWTLAKLCQRAEHRHPGVPCGLLDQTGAVFGRANTLLLLDCASLELEPLPLGHDDLSLVFVDSRSKHTLVDGQYRARRAECEDAVAQMTGLLDRELDWMRDVTSEEFARIEDRIQGSAAERARHVFRENDRCVQGREALHVGDFETLGRLISQSHRSSRIAFENSTPQLDLLVDIATAHDACLGAKLCGGGFGGCTVNLVRTAHCDAFIETVLDTFEQKTQVRTEAFSAPIGDGAYTVG